MDIGSGDGRIVVGIITILISYLTTFFNFLFQFNYLKAAAKNGFKAHGVELNPWLVQYSRVSALTNGVSAMTSFYRKDLWTFNVSNYKYIVIFGVEQMVKE